MSRNHCKYKLVGEFLVNSRLLLTGAEEETESIKDGISISYGPVYSSNLSTTESHLSEVIMQYTAEATILGGKAL